MHPVLFLQKMRVLLFAYCPEGVVVFWLNCACCDECASRDVPAEGIAVGHVEGQGVVGRDWSRGAHEVFDVFAVVVADLVAGFEGFFCAAYNVEGWAVVGGARGQV